MRLIDADALKIKGFADEFSGEGIVCVQDIDEAPTIDAVPVVRCRCCKEFIPCAGEHGICFRHSEVWSKNGFCSVGERKDK